MKKVFLSLGSNLGNREANLRQAILRLREFTTITQVSPVYDTAPQYVEDQPQFLNIACEISTRLSPQELLRIIKGIEHDMGRERSIRNGPRLIDIDILFYGNESIEIEGLSIPHPRMQERAFVIAPLADIAPDFVHPQLQKSIVTLKSELATLETVKKTDTNLLATHTKGNTFIWGSKTYLMGIVNCTPDSFSGDGLGSSVDAAVAQARQQIADGADIVDTGGESTRPGSTPLSLEEELARVIPVIERLAKEITIPISIDTYKAEVARQAINAGASIINDVWGGTMDPEILKVAAELNVPIILMHNRSEPKNAEQQAQLGGRYIDMKYDDLLTDIKKELQESIDAALAAGVKPENIIVDPGIGFGKTVEQNLELLNRFKELHALGYPILSGPSRKSFVGFTLNLPPEERLEGTAAAVALSIERGADIVRVHDVKEMNRVAKFTDVVVR